MSQKAQDLSVAAHAIGFYLQSLHERIVNNKSRRAGDRLAIMTLRDRYRRYYETRERLGKSADDSEPKLEVPTPDSF